MKFGSFSLILFFIGFSQVYANPFNSPNCRSEKSDESFLVVQDFRWGYKLAELLEKFVEIYQSEKRLKNRAYWDQSKKSLVLPYNDFNGGPVKINAQFVKNVAGHIEQGIKHKIVDAVFFPDMGHSHIFIPQQKYTQFYDKFEVSQFSQFYENLFQDTEIQILYHTAEQLQMLDQNNQLLPEERLRFRHATRNLVGSTDGSNRIQWISNSQSPANTAHDLPGYHYWGAGFNLSGNKSGCFSASINGRELKFDISLFDLESNSIETSDSESM